MQLVQILHRFDVSVVTDGLGGSGGGVDGAIREAMMQDMTQGMTQTMTQDAIYVDIINFSVFSSPIFGTK